MSIRNHILTALILIAVIVPLNAQTNDAKQIATKAAETRMEFFKAFSDLSATETKTFRLFNKKGELKRTRSVQATFFVYQLSTSTGSLVEFRNVRSVNGREIADVDKRTEQFFSKLANVKNSASERENIRDESSKYDDELTIDGATLNQSISLADNLIDHFDFTYVGVESIDGKPSFVIDYSQNKYTEDIAIRKDSLPDDGKTRISHYADNSDYEKLSERLSGRLWIDQTTFQVRREYRQFTAVAKKDTKPSPLYMNQFDYIDSEFGILLPKTLVYTEFDYDKKTAKYVKDASITFEYGKFTRPNVEVESGEVNSEN